MGTLYVRRKGTWASHAPSTSGMAPTAPRAGGRGPSSAMGAICGYWPLRPSPYYRHPVWTLRAFAKQIVYIVILRGHRVHKRKGGAPAFGKTGRVEPHRPCPSSHRLLVTLIPRYIESCYTTLGLVTRTTPHFRFLPPAPFPGPARPPYQRECVHGLTCVCLLLSARNRLLYLPVRSPPPALSCPLPSPPPHPAASLPSPALPQHPSTPSPPPVPPHIAITSYIYNLDDLTPPIIHPSLCSTTTAAPRPPRAASVSSSRPLPVVHATPPSSSPETTTRDEFTSEAVNTTILTGDYPKGHVNATNNIDNMLPIADDKTRNVNISATDFPESLRKDCLLFYAQGSEPLAKRIANTSNHVTLGSIKWGKFNDQFPNLFVNDALSVRNKHVAFLASFDNPAVIFEQLSIIYALPRLFVSSFTLVLPYFPTGTAERMENEGDVATAFTLARMLSNIPLSRGGPTSIVIFDIHALQERFYFGDTVLPLFESGIPLLRQRIKLLKDHADVAIAYPDEGTRDRRARERKTIRMDG